MGNSYDGIVQQISKDSGLVQLTSEGAVFGLVTSLSNLQRIQRDYPGAEVSVYLESRSGRVETAITPRDSQPQ